MTVVDASAMVEGLLGRSPDDSLLVALSGEVSAPHLLDVEVMSVLRGLSVGGKVSPQRAEEARHDYFDLTVVRTPMEPLAERVWALRHQLTSYDATYVALAEALGVELLTCDAKLAAPGHRTVVRVIGRST